MKKILAAIALAATFLSGVGFTVVQAAVTFKVVQTPVYHLYTGEAASATSIRITPYPTDLDAVKLTMTDFGSKPTVTVDPNLKGTEEIESFTGITDNGDNTATLTGLSRDLQSKYPYTGTGTGRSHGSGATVVFGNNPQVYGRLGALENDQTWTGTDTFGSTTQPVYDGNPTFSNPLALINKAYADALSITGAPTSTFSGMGVVQLATMAQIGAGTASSSAGAPFVIPAKAATSTYNPCCWVQGNIIALNANKVIDQMAIATSTGNNYNWGGAHTFGATTTFNGAGTTTISGTGGLLVTASTTINATTTILGISAESKPGQNYTSGTTTISWPMAMYLGTSTGKAFTGASNVASTTLYFIGFSQGILTSGTQGFIQTSGVVSGFSGLTSGSDYYLQDNGTIGTGFGTYEAYVGTAVSTTQLLIQPSRGGQYMGSGTVPPIGARYALVQVSGSNGSFTINYQMTVYANGVTSATQQGGAQNSGGGSIASYGISCSWGNPVSCSSSAGGFSGFSVTAYFYR